MANCDGDLALKSAQEEVKRLREGGSTAGKAVLWERKRGR